MIAIDVVMVDMLSGMVRSNKSRSYCPIWVSPIWRKNSCYVDVHVIEQVRLLLLELESRGIDSMMIMR